MAPQSRAAIVEVMECIGFGIGFEGRTARLADGLGVGWEKGIKDDQDFWWEKLVSEGAVLLKQEELEVKQASKVGGSRSSF